MPDPVGPLRYRGSDGEALMGVPARDLSVEDVAALRPYARGELAAHLDAGGKLYAAVKGGQTPAAGDTPPAMSKDS